MGTKLRRVTVLGAGVLGSQIAYQCAFHGFEVISYDVNEDALAAARERFKRLPKAYLQDQVAGADEASTQAAIGRITQTTSLSEAAQADLIIEAAPEVLELKRQLYTQLGELAPPETIFATNSSTLLPSAIKAYTGRPERFLALHFANQIWKANTAEVMGTEETLSEVFDEVVAFAGEIGMVPIPIYKEKAGYVLNSLLVPFLHAAAELAAFGYAAPADVDKTWKIATGAPLGPFEFYDIIGLNTPYNIMSHGDDKAKQIAAWLKANYIDKGKLGRASGEGFYRYRYDE